MSFDKQDIEIEYEYFTYIPTKRALPDPALGIVKYHMTSTTKQAVYLCFAQLAATYVTYRVLKGTYHNSNMYVTMSLRYTYKGARFIDTD
jgi:hypothetical protein